MPAEDRFATVDGSRVHYENYGKGDTALVLIHGWTCDTNVWRDQIADFSKRNRVLAVDLPGHGKSDKPEVTYSMDLFARAVDAVMRDAKVRRAVLIGHSMGTPVARQFYRNYPKKTLAIVAVDGPLMPFGEPAMIDNMTAGIRAPTYRDTIGQLFTMMTTNLAEEAKQRINSSTANTPKHVIVSAWEQMNETLKKGDDKINVPVLALMAKSPFFPPDIEQRYKSVAPGMEWLMWDGVGHFIMMEKPKEFNAAVLAFLDKNKLAKKS
jgi:pimeloyl-ACP methyl ester carboxylesterase